MKKIKLDEDIPLLEFGSEFQISGLVFSGHGQSFITTLPHKTEDINEPLDHLVLSQEDLAKVIRQLDLLETEIFTEDANGKMVKAIVRKTQRQIGDVAQWTTWARDNYTCRYCGRTGVPLSVDHVDLWEEGGLTLPENLVTACKSCNRDRGRMPYEAWLTSPSYLQRSHNLGSEIKALNQQLVQELPNLKSRRLTHVMSR